MCDHYWPSLQLACGQAPKFEVVTKLIDNGLVSMEIDSVLGWEALFYVDWSMDTCWSANLAMFLTPSAIFHFCK